MQDRALEIGHRKARAIGISRGRAALMIGGGISAGETAGFVLGRSKAAGRVARHEVIRSDDGISYYYPVIEFENTRGERVEFRSKDRSSSQPYRIGHPIQVLYDARDPHHAAINSFGSLWGDPGMLFLMGLGFAGLAGIVLIASSEQDRGAPTGKGRGKRAAGRPPASGRGPTAWDRGRPGSTGGHLILLAFFIVGLGLTIGGASWAWVTNDFIAGAPGPRVASWDTRRHARGRDACLASSSSVSRPRTARRWNSGPVSTPRRGPMRSATRSRSSTTPATPTRRTSRRSTRSGSAR